MKRRRMLFATPFVLVVGCKRPIEPVTPGEHDETDEDRAPTYVAGPMWDGPMAWPTRIDPPDPADVDAAPERIRYTGCGRHPDGTFTTCNPPPPDAWTTGNPPGPMRYRIVNLQVSGPDFIAIVGGGSAQGVQKGWKATLVDNSDRATKSDVVIVRVDKNTTTVKIQRVTADQIKAAGSVRFSPP